MSLFHDSIVLENLAIVKLLKLLTLGIENAHKLILRGEKEWKLKNCVPYLYHLR